MLVILLVDEIPAGIPPTDMALFNVDFLLFLSPSLHRRQGSWLSVAHPDNVQLSLSLNMQSSIYRASCDGPRRTADMKYYTRRLERRSVSEHLYLIVYL